MPAIFCGTVSGTVPVKVPDTSSPAGRPRPPGGAVCRNCCKLRVPDRAAAVALLDTGD